MTVGSKAFDLVDFVNGIGILAALQSLDHGQEQAIANAVAVNLEEVDFESPHDAIDDDQSGHDKIGPIGIESRDFSALLERKFSKSIDQVS